MGSGIIDTAVFLQVRLKSKRLPYKAILPLKGGTVMGHIINALECVNADLHVIVTDRESVKFLKPYTLNSSFEIFEGSEDDVLERFCMAARKYLVKTIIRATGDNPLVSCKYANKILELHKKTKADLSHYLGIPLGTGVEVIESNALFRVESETKDVFEREHLTTYMYRHRDQFKVIEPYPERDVILEGVKVSVDTVSDYKKISRIYNEAYHGKPIEVERLIKWLRDNRI